MSNTKDMLFFQTVTCKSLILGNGIPIVTTALALSSVKSKPSLTFPLQTATSSAPSGKRNHNQHTDNTFKLGIWNKSTLTSVFTVGCCSSDGLIVGLQKLIKITLATTTWLSDHSLSLLKLFPQTCVHPAVPQFIQHLNTKNDQEKNIIYTLFLCITFSSCIRI